MQFCKLVDSSAWGEDDGDNHSVETEGLSEDEDKNHTNEDLFLLSISSYTGVTYNTNCETSGLYRVIITGNITRDERPQQSPDAKCLNPMKGE